MKEVLKQEEKVVFALRSLYENKGYSLYKMSKFEEYELYIKNKDFLVSDRVITFNDTNGKLLALKPDVTLSIIKNGEDKKGCKQKVYYNENVYRISESTHRFKEIMQTGLECIGDIDLYDVFEVISLSAQSLSVISPRFVLELSDIGLIQNIIDKSSSDLSFKSKALTFIESKNRHDLTILCKEYGVERKYADMLTALPDVHGSRKEVLQKLRTVGVEGLEELTALSELLDLSPFSDNIEINFSVVGNTRYYNGFVFKGYIDGVCGSILSGGQYDNMMKKMNRNSKAIGFAVYLDLLERLDREIPSQKVDVLILYDDKTDKKDIVTLVKKAEKEGKRVAVEKDSSYTDYQTVWDIRGEKC